MRHKNLCPSARRALSARRILAHGSHLRGWRRRSGFRGAASPSLHVGDHWHAQPNDGAARHAVLLFDAAHGCRLRRVPRSYRASSASADHLHAHRYALATPHSPPVPALRYGRPFATPGVTSPVHLARQRNSRLAQTLPGSRHTVYQAFQQARVRVPPGLSRTAPTARVRFSSPCDDHHEHPVIRPTML